MDRSNTMTREHLGDGIVLYQNVQTSFGPLYAVYTGPGGIFVHLESTDQDPEAIYLSIRDLLQTVHLRLYVEGLGIYDPRSKTFSALSEQEELEERIFRQILTEEGERPRLTAAAQESIQTRLNRSDAMTRGWYLGEDGRIYLRRGKGFRRASEQSGQILFYTTLFGGTFGAHRFLEGKIFTGLLYLLTGGLLLIGWGADLLFLLLGIAKDKRGDLIEPLSRRPFKLLLLPVGFAASFLSLQLILWSMTQILNGFGLSITRSLAQENSALSMFLRWVYNNLSSL